MAILLSGLGDDGRRSRWNFCTHVQIPQTKVARTAPKTNLYYKTNRALALPRSKFRRANPTSDPSLEFCFFLSRKRREPFGGQPRQGCAAGKVYGKWSHQPIDECYKKMSFTLRVKRILSCHGRTGLFFLLTAKETKLPARNFFIQVSSWARSVPSQKIDHAGLRAERRNGGLALLGSDSDRHSCYKSKSAS